MEKVSSEFIAVVDRNDTTVPSLASHLSDSERSLLIKTARDALDTNGLPLVPIVAGTGAGSARETIRLCCEARDAGADYVIVISPGYFASTIGCNKAALKGFYLSVLDNSRKQSLFHCLAACLEFTITALPVMIYNFPGASAGIDLDSNLLIELSEHQNCFGAKVRELFPARGLWLTPNYVVLQLTCAMIGKGHRLSAHTLSEDYKARHRLPFFVLPGYSDILLPALVSRATGCITGTGAYLDPCILSSKI